MSLYGVSAGEGVSVVMVPDHKVSAGVPGNNITTA